MIYYLKLRNNRLMQVIWLAIIGALLTFSYHPFNIFFVVPISLSLLLSYLESIKTLKQKFIATLIFAYSHFLTSLCWIVNSLFVDIERFWWMIPLVLILIPLIIAIFIGLLVVTAEYFSYHKVAYALGFSALWVVFEYVRSFLLFPFPWNLLGYTTLSVNQIAQFASIVGVYGMSFIVCLVGTCFYTRNKNYIIVVLTCFMLIFCFGYLRLKNSKIEYLEDYTFRLVQPNFSEHHMGDARKQSKDFLKLIEMSLKDLKENTITIWPEGAFPYVLSNNSSFKKIFPQLISKNGVLITGADWVEINELTTDWNIYNAIVTINKQGEVVSIYKKALLVPFGEYIPLRKYFPNFIEKVAYGIGDFTAGEEFKTTKISNNLPSILNMICFESIFTHIPHYYANEEFGIMLNLTNDAWFGNSIGPYQHFNMARMRAIEYSTPLIRVAKHGISAIIDQYGRVLASIEINKEGILNAKVPKKTLHSSVYLLYYHISAIGIVLLLLLLIGIKIRFK